MRRTVATGRPAALCSESVWPVSAWVFGQAGACGGRVGESCMRVLARSAIA
ncbi:hypothetical protein NSU_2021 [Novosphingobium pentaromativorans US6-1]|uniref:Uncharacterized protein n=1 Tax=Novosphingobium pentaromativorans US6-1 TaxID=1088721 RepID=G6ECF1_9SPHN|nr:hypothetical protein NSU_2021 [Novosphingobium pentaromativorans US6-1]